MTKDKSPKDPNQPDDFQKDILEQMKRLMDQGFQVRTPEPPPASKAAEKSKAQEAKSKALEFDFKPKDVKKHLDRFVVKQEEAKRVLATAVCDHYNHVKAWESGEKNRHYVKQNVLLLGPTGVGKTYLVRCLADLIGVPFVKADATKFSETGYAGGDVDDLVRNLVQQAGGDTDLAEYGIIYLDEIDKLSSASNTLGRDVSGGGVQRGLLKIMEDTEVAAKNPQDIQAQFEAVMNLQRGKGKAKQTINTRHILFIASGAFTGLDEIVKKRQKENKIGFSASKSAPTDLSALLRDVSTGDFIEYGFEPEFVGRLPIRVTFDYLNEEDLFTILSSSEESILKQYKTAFSAYGITVHTDEKALWEMAKLAAVEKTGARALSTVCERVFRSFKYELPSSSVSEFRLTPETVHAPVNTLDALLEQDREELKTAIKAALELYLKIFLEKYDLQLSFTAEAEAKLTERIIREELDTEVFLAKHLSNYSHGLDLIRQKTGENKFELTEEVVSNPNATLDEWIKKSYEK